MYISLKCCVKSRKIVVYVSVLCELIAEDITLQKFECEYLYSVTSGKIILIFLEFKTGCKQSVQQLKAFL